MSEMKTIQATMTSLDLLEMVNVSRIANGENPISRLNDFHARIADELEGEYYESFVKPPGASGGRPTTAYRLTRDQCMLVSMRESKSVRRNVLQKLKAMDSPALPDFNDPVASARAWADAKESEQAALAQLEQAKPAVEFVGRFVDTGTTKTVRETSKLLGLPEKAFIQALIDDKILYRQSGNLLPHQRHHAADRFTVKTGERNGYAYTQTRVTSIGIDWLANRYGDWIGEKA